jgi:hypothetical protein
MNTSAAARECLQRCFGGARPQAPSSPSPGAASASPRPRCCPVVAAGALAGSWAAVGRPWLASHPSPHGGTAIYKRVTHTRLQLHRNTGSKGTEGALVASHAWRSQELWRRAGPVGGGRQPGRGAPRHSPHGTPMMTVRRSTCQKAVTGLSKARISNIALRVQGAHAAPRPWHCGRGGRGRARTSGKGQAARWGLQRGSPKDGGSGCACSAPRVEGRMHCFYIALQAA